MSTTASPAFGKNESARQVMKSWTAGMSQFYNRYGHKESSIRSVLFCRLIGLIWSEDCFTINVAADRIGFDPLSAQTVGHFGLLMCKLEKVLLGNLDVDISTGEGAQLNFRIPLVPSQASTERSNVAHISFYSHDPVLLTRLI